MAVDVAWTSCPLPPEMPYGRVRMDHVVSKPLTGHLSDVTSNQFEEEQTSNGNRTREPQRVCLLMAIRMSLLRYRCLISCGCNTRRVRSLLLDLFNPFAKPRTNFSLQLCLIVL